MMLPLYATREEVKRRLDIKETARANAQIDDALAAASRNVEGLTHRRFYPEIATRYFDWPRQYARPWRLWLESNELISITSLQSGTTTIPASQFFLRRSDDRDEPPYTLLELDLDTSAAFGVSATMQRDISITGLFGYRNDETTVGTLAAAISTTTATTITVDGPASAALGVGSVLRIDNERLIVTGRAQATTGQTVLTPLTTAKNDETVQVTTGSAFAVDEVLLVDSERMLIVDIAGNALTVKRAWDGSTLAAHTGSTIYAPRTLTVTRGALGTTATTHLNAAPAYRLDVPGPVKALTIAETLMTIQMEVTGYSQTKRSGEGTTRPVSGAGLADLRDQVYNSHGRKARSRAV